MSPNKKKMKINDDRQSTSMKRHCESDGGSCKRSKSAQNPVEDIQVIKRKNFVTACQQVSYNAYFNHRARLMLLYLPPCMKISVCKHYVTKSTVSQMSPKAEEAFMIDARSNEWCEALEVCKVCITPNQYLSAKVLKEIVEIMLNAHEDEYAGHSVSYLIDKCQQILMQNFSTHPPCLMKTSYNNLKTCYTDFLISPLEIKDKTFTNRASFGYDKGIVKYCMDRLEYEISAESKDESLVDKCENIPEEMKQSVKGLHWQKEKFEIYECHARTERIDRLMVVLDTIIEVLQFDLAIWHSSYTKNLGSHIMRSHKPLMAHYLWSNNILYTGAVNSNCRQLLKLFVNLVHLQYPEAFITTMTTWLNAVIQTFYICETNSNSDYPNTQKYCPAFANEFYKIVAELPQESIIRVLEKIQPTFMRHLIGTQHVSKLLYTEETCIIRNLINFIKEAKWNNYPESRTSIQIAKTTKPKNIKKEIRYLIKKCTEWSPDEGDEVENKCYRKMEAKLVNDEVNRNHVVHTLFITLGAYLDAYSVQDVQETLDNLNKLVETGLTVTNFQPEPSSYSVTEHFIKKYRSIFQNMNDLVLLLQEVKNGGELPSVLKVFDKLDLLT